MNEWMNEYYCNDLSDFLLKSLGLDPAKLNHLASKAYQVYSSRIGTTILLVYMGTICLINNIAGYDIMYELVFQV